MTNPFLTNINLHKAIDDAKLEQDQKDALIKVLPQLDEQDRVSLLNVLKDVALLESEQDDATKKIKENWQ